LWYGIQLLTDCVHRSHSNQARLSLHVEQLS
jgi:hypothetical protein